MNFFNRAIKNVTRGKTKSILLMITFFLIGNLVIIGLGVSYASENAKKLTRMKMKPAIQYTVDYDAFYRYVRDLDSEAQEEAYNHYPRVTISAFKKIIDNDRVEGANATYTSYHYATDLDVFPGENENDGYGGGIVYDEIDEAYEEEYVYHDNNMSLFGNYFPSMIEINDGTYEITSGRFYTQEEIDNYARVCLITEELAERNNLRVGDTFHVEMVEYWYRLELGDKISDEDAVFEFEIIGIYKNNKQLSDDDWRKNMAAYRLENMILTPASTVIHQEVTVQQMMYDYWAELWPDDEYYSNPDYRPNEDNYASQMILMLDDPLYVDEFIEENKDLLEPYTKLDANDAMFNTFAKPLDTMSLFANIIVWIVVINAIVIITLVTALTMKNREHEIGILLSMGVSKLKVVAQLFIELAIVAILGFTLAVASGSLIAKGVGQAVLDYQLTSNTENDDYYYYYSDDSYFTTISQDDMISEYEVSVSPLIIGEIYAVGLGVVLLATVIPSFMIMRFNPKKILTDTL